MTKLKTLKDLNHYNINDLKRKDFIGIALNSSIKKRNVKVELLPIFIFEKQLKEEAIKQIRKLQKIDYSTPKAFSNASVVNWIKYFFNITEEESK